MAKHPLKLILASRSPRRRELLAAAGYDFEVFPPSDDAEDGHSPGETPGQLVARLARQKAADVVRQVSEIRRADIPVCLSEPRRTDIPVCLTVADDHGRQECLPSCSGICLVLGCDTVAECHGHILGKPADRDDARAMLTALSGQEHRVLSGLCLWPLPAGEPSVRVAVTTLRMDELTPAKLDAYLASGQWEGKAGAFGYQDGIDWVHVVKGSESNVVGLPMELLAEMIKALQ
jgi:septum formation protein